MKSTNANAAGILLAILLLGVSVCAQERVSGENETAFNSAVTPNTTDSDSPAGVPPICRVSAALEGMSASERSNSMIEITALGYSDPQVLSVINQAESLWNQYDHQKAVALLKELEGTRPGLSLEVANCWRVPVATSDDSRFGTDVRIGGRDSVEAACLDIHRASGVLFASLVLLGDGYQSRLAMYFSSDGGATWAETFYHAFTAYTVPSHSIAVVDDHCYLAWVAYDTLVSVRQFRITNGTIEQFSTGLYASDVFSVSPPASVSEVCLVSNQDFNSPGYYRLYLWALTSSNSIRLFWDNEGAVSWTEVATGIADAASGLDVSINQDYSSYFMYLSYQNINDSLYVRGTNGMAFPLLLKRSMGAAHDITSIGAYRDTVHCFYEYQSTLLQCRYQVSYNGGTTWSWGVVDDTSVISEQPAITARAGGGVGMAYRYYTPTREGRFTWRRYSGWPWPTPQVFSDYQPYYNQPAIEYLGSGRFGIVYTSWNTPLIRAAYFDRGSGCCAGLMGNIDGSEDGLVTMGDLTVLIDHLFISLTPLACAIAANVDQSVDGLITMGDLTVLIDHLFISLTPLPACP